MESRYRQYFDEMPCYVTVQDPDLRILDANRRFREEFGDRTGEPCYRAYRNRAEKCARCPVEETFRDGEPHGYEEALTPRDGRERPVLVTTRPIRDDHGRIAAVMQICTEIPEVRRIQDKLTSLELLVGSITHGIKGQLTGVDGGVYLMNSGYARNSPDRVQKGLAMVQRNLERIRSLVTDILYYARDRTPQWEPVSASALASEIVRTMEKKAQDLGAAFSSDVDPDAGEFEADPRAIRSLLGNLLECSLDACRSAPGKEEHRVRFSISRNAETMLFRVEDSGAGIDRETRDKALSPWFSKGIEGAGLGLFIAGKIVRSHGGTLEVESTPGQGTAFRVRIPRRRTAPLPPGSGEPGLGSGTNAGTGGIPA